MASFALEHPFDHREALLLHVRDRRLQLAQGEAGHAAVRRGLREEGRGGSEVGVSSAPADLGLGRDCRFVPPLIRFIPDSLPYIPQFRCLYF
jgi:hypothetical protein